MRLVAENCLRHTGQQGLPRLRSWAKHASHNTKCRKMVGPLLLCFPVQAGFEGCARGRLAHWLGAAKN